MGSTCFPGVKMGEKVRQHICQSTLTSVLSARVWRLYHTISAHKPDGKIGTCTSLCSLLHRKLITRQVFFFLTTFQPLLASSTASRAKMPCGRSFVQRKVLASNWNTTCKGATLPCSDALSLSSDGSGAGLKVGVGGIPVYTYAVLHWYCSGIFVYSSYWKPDTDYIVK